MNINVMNKQVTNERLQVLFGKLKNMYDLYYEKSTYAKSSQDYCAGIVAGSSELMYEVERWVADLPEQLKEKEPNMNPNLIEVGDIVSVDFGQDACLFDGTVLHVPTPGLLHDNWHIRDGKGRLQYVDRFEAMVIVEKGG